MKGVRDFMFCENVCGENIQEGGRGRGREGFSTN